MIEFPAYSYFLDEKRRAIIKLCKFTTVQDVTRGDYKELIFLTLLYLRYEYTKFTKFQKPGAYHKARWMAKLLYSIKMTLLKKQILDMKISTITQMKKIDRFSEFIVYCYVPWWITATITTAAPINDLKLMKILRSYDETDPILAKAAFTALNRHTWYLCEELIPLSLFSCIITNDVKSKIVSKILKYKTSANWLFIWKTIPTKASRNFTE